MLKYFNREAPTSIWGTSGSSFKKNEEFVEICCLIAYGIINI
jgi:hypothetical protein